MNKMILDIKDLQVNLMSAQGVVHAVRGVDLQIGNGEIHGIVGESGCGKSMTVKSIMRLHNEERVEYKGSILFGEEHRDILKLGKKELQSLRGSEIAMIFQDPMSSLNPIMKVGKQVEEMIVKKTGISKEAAKAQIYDLFKKIGIVPTDKRFEQYPFQMSGGLLQRIMIAIAMSCSPRLLIADEPTTALDVTIQAQILELMKKLQKEKGMSIIIVTHNLGVIAEMCHRVSVMYAGRIMETASVVQLFDSPKHPYTKALLESNPKYGNEKGYLATISGTPPGLIKPFKGCPYAARCKYVQDICRSKESELIEVDTGRSCSCHLIGNMQ